jgi:hypothetical protein
MLGEGATSVGPLRESRLITSGRLGALSPRFSVEPTDTVPNYGGPRAIDLIIRNASPIPR